MANLSGYGSGHGTQNLVGVLVGVPTFLCLFVASVKTFYTFFYFVMFILEIRWWCYTFQPPFLCFCKKFLQLFLFMLWTNFLILNNAYYLWLWCVCICNFNLHGLLARAFFVRVFHGCMLNHHNAWPHAHALIDCSMYVICLCIWSFHHEAYLRPWNGHKSQYSDFVESFIQEHVSQIF